MTGKQMKFTVAKFSPQNQDFFEHDRVVDCREAIVNCPICGKRGHITAHILNTKKRLQKKGRLQVAVNRTISHSHFLDPNIGRNVNCNFNQIWIDAVKCDTVYRLSPEQEEQIKRRGLE